MARGPRGHSLAGKAEAATPLLGALLSRTERLLAKAAKVAKAAQGAEAATLLLPALTPGSATYWTGAATPLLLPVRIVRPWGGPQR